MAVKIGTGFQGVDVSLMAWGCRVAVCWPKSLGVHGLVARKSKYDPTPLYSFYLFTRSIRAGAGSVRLDRIVGYS